jgi:hypothetical protein
MQKDGKPKRGRDCPPKTILPIPDTFENVVNALVRPVEYSPVERKL